ncbi:MAG: DUF2029 domain-containing protein [Kiritimatiellaeota bacterium]|nr:DUF2029 domain-containing protein [Kiritimatiellota bacterium]
MNDKNDGILKSGTPYIASLFATVIILGMLSLGGSFLINGRFLKNILPLGGRRGIDLIPVMVASRSMMAGYSIYENNSKHGRRFTDFLAEKNKVRYVYPPLAAYIFAPLAFLPDRLSYWVWSIIQTAIVLGLVVACCLKLNFSPLETVALVGLLIFSYPVTFLMERGNFDALVMLFYLSSFFFWLEKRNEYLVASCLSVAILLKLFPAAFLFFFIFKKEWGIVVKTVVISMFLSVIAGLRFIPEYGANLAGLLASLPRHLFVANHSTVCFLLRLQATMGCFSDTATEISIYGSHLINAAVFAFIAFHSWKWRNKTGDLPRMVEICAYMLFMSVASAISYDYKLVFMCFIVPVLVKGVARMNGEKRHLWLTIAIYICLAHCLIPTWGLIGNHSGLLAIALASKFPFMVALIFAIVRLNAILIAEEKKNIAVGRAQLETCDAAQTSSLDSKPFSFDVM